MAQRPVSAALADYAANATVLVPRWLAIDPTDVHAPVLHLFPDKPSRILDIGAGVGRDAGWLAGLGHSVLAVEPVDGFREAGLAHHSRPGIEWLDDRLPELATVMAREETFDLVMLTAVWAHLDPDQRRIAMPNIAALLVVGGRLLMSIRNGWTPPSRPTFDAAPEETIALAAAEGLSVILHAQSDSIQPVNKANGVTWTRLAFEKR
ncbi:MAG: class I SAM-dependent methyltransferase [Alphaproteobacteria bacterium]|nr:class I SAM-dependent methyltransferase [Alphaproteobacteria bacterium]